jgi:hypothetical protein
LEFLDDAAQSDQARVGWDVSHEVDIAVGSVLAARDATGDTAHIDIDGGVEYDARVG